MAGFTTFPTWTVRAELSSPHCLCASWRRIARAAAAALRITGTVAGVVRDSEEGVSIRAIDDEAFEQMARHQFELIFQEIEKRWSIESVRLIHRIGVVQVNEPSLWVELVAPHRGEAFAACQFLIDEMKRVVPIWKKPLAGTQG